MRTEQEHTHVVALSGGKDSTALALRLAELHPDREWLYFCSPTGDELPDVVAHWDRLECILGQQIVKVRNRSLDEWIEHFDMIPNHRARWCTRLLKIEPCLEYLRSLDAPVLYVGLRWDEPARNGIYTTQFPSVFPMREWGWTVKDVHAYLQQKGITIPKRTDCARCYGQRLSEWYELRRLCPEIYEAASQQEKAVRESRGLGVTFRSPQRDTWPASLEGLGREFERRYPRGYTPQVPLFDLAEEPTGCRVCRL